MFPYLLIRNLRNKRFADKARWLIDTESVMCSSMSVETTGQTRPNQQRQPHNRLQRGVPFAERCNWPREVLISEWIQFRCSLVKIILQSKVIRAVAYACFVSRKIVKKKKTIISGHAKCANCIVKRVIHFLGFVAVVWGPLYGTSCILNELPMRWDGLLFASEL